MSEIVREASEGPLCPNGLGSPIHPAHELRVRVLDAFYEATEKDDDGEMPAPVETAYGAAAYGVTTDRMDLFRHSSAFFSGNRQVLIESYWFRCRVCGLILPASEVRR